MEETYKTHQIIASSWQLAESQQWEPRVQVFWQEAGKQHEKPLVFTKPCASEQEAEQEGLKLAKKWIDDGKPELRVGPT